MMVHMEVQSTDGVTIAVHDLGGAGPPLVICHATGFCAGAYRPLAEHLAGARHVWALDFRGHGDSSVPDGDRFDWDGSADDLLAVLDALGGEPVDAVGHSMGGASAMLVERRRPGALRSAYLYEPIIFPPEMGRPAGAENPMAEAARRRRDEFPTKAAALWRYATATPLRVLNAGALAAYVEHGFAETPEGTARLKLSPAHEAAVFEASGAATLETVQGLDLPVTVAVGGASGEGNPGPALWAPAVAAALPNGALRTFEHLGHFGPLQDPAAVAADILGFLERAGP